MSKFVTFPAALALLCSGITVAVAAENGASVTCKDGTKGHVGKDACSDHGGAQKSKSASTPIDTTKGFTPNNTSTSAKNKTHTSSTSSTTRKKASSKATRTPTAKCNDGAQYFSTERRGACASHGGVKTWY